MNSKLTFGIILALVFTASPVVAQVCSADKMQTLPGCVLKGLQKSPTTSGSFTQWYEVQNQCGYDVEVVIQFSTGAEIAVALSNNQKDGASLPEGMEVTGFYCCSAAPSCELDK